LNTASEAVARVEIIAHPAAMALCYRRHPKDAMEGHVSLYHWVAVALARGRAGIAEGTDQAIADPTIRALRDRIDVIDDPAIPHDGADVTVRLGNGTSAVRRVRSCIGSRGRPMTNAELDRKFAAAAEGVLSGPKIDAYLASIRGVETLGDARAGGRCACSVIWRGRAGGAVPASSACGSSMKRRSAVDLICNPPSR
jgi:2-methylcitrate dehydratase PrpD